MYVFLFQASLVHSSWISKCIQQDQIVQFPTVKEENNDEPILSESEIGLLDPTFKNCKYDCMRKTPLVHGNEDLIEYLEMICRCRYLDSDYRSQDYYERAISAIKAYPRDIKSADEAKAICSIGPKIASKVYPISLD